ncbi:MAG: Franean1_4349 family RiPP [Anaerolineae bacterium]|nr:Franean1_4349 family RiPP [Anaerolineae bacterium]
MTHAALSQVIGTALVDDGFRRVLLRNPKEALAPFDLASDELTALSRIRAHTLEQFAAQLVTWFAEADRTCRA